MIASNRIGRRSAEASGPTRSWKAGRALLVAGMVLATAVAASSPALARNRGHDRQRRQSDHRHERVVRHEVFRSGPAHHRRAARPFVVPRVMRHRPALAYERYYVGRAWYGPHRHRHAVYYFPVWSPTGWMYEPHFYCNGDLFVDSHYLYRDSGGRLIVGGHVDIGGPRFRVHVGF